VHHASDDAIDIELICRGTIWIDHFYTTSLEFTAVFVEVPPWYAILCCYNDCVWPKQCLYFLGRRLDLMRLYGKYDDVLRADFLHIAGSFDIPCGMFTAVMHH